MPGIDPAYTKNTQNTPLHYAVTYKNVKFIRRLADKIGGQKFQQLVRLQNKLYETPLHRVASSPGRSDLINAFLENLDSAVVGDIIRFKDKHGDTPLHYAAINNNAQFIKEVSHKLRSQIFQDVMEIQNNNKRTPVHEVAAFPNNTEVMNIFFNHLGSASLYMIAKTQDNSGNTPLHIAAINNNAHVIVKLSEKLGSSFYELVWITNKTTKTPLGEVINQHDARHALFSVLDNRNLRELVVRWDSVGGSPIFNAIYDHNETFLQELVNNLDFQSVMIVLQEIRGNPQIRNLSWFQSAAEMLYQNALKGVLYDLYHYLDALHSKVAHVSSSKV